MIIVITFNSLIHDHGCIKLTLIGNAWSNYGTIPFLMLQLKNKIKWKGGEMLKWTMHFSFFFFWTIPWASVQWFKMTVHQGLNVSHKNKIQEFFWVLRCPFFIPPENGRLISGVCGNVFGSVCRLQCNKGYILKGSIARTCDKVLGTNEVRWAGTASVCEGKWREWVYSIAKMADFCF